MVRRFGYYEKSSLAIAILLLSCSVPCFLFAYNFYLKSTFLFIFTLSLTLVLLVGSIYFFYQLVQFKKLDGIQKEYNKNNKNCINNAQCKEEISK